MSLLILFKFKVKELTFTFHTVSHKSNLNQSNHYNHVIDRHVSTD